MNLTLSQRRERAARIRRAAFLMIGVGLLVALAAIVVLSLELTFVGGTASMFTNCGSPLAPNQFPAGTPQAQACATEFAAQVGTAAILGVGAIALFVTATVLLVRTPAPMRF